MTIFDLVRAPEIASYWKEMTQDAPPYLGETLFPPQKKLGLKRQIFLFDLKMSALTTRKIPAYTEISKYPSIKRDFAILVDSTVTADNIINTVIINKWNLETQCTLMLS